MMRNGEAIPYKTDSHSEPAMKSSALMHYFQCSSDLSLQMLVKCHIYNHPYHYHKGFEEKNKHDIKELGG